MGIIGNKIKQNLTVVSHTIFLEKIQEHNEGKDPSDPAYINLESEAWEGNIPPIDDNPNIDIRYADAIGNAVENYIEGTEGTYLPIDTPVWDFVAPIVESIDEIESNVFRPTITLKWDSLPPIPIWDEHTIYDFGDVVEKESEFYISIIDENEGNDPPENLGEWKLLRLTEIETKIFRKEGTGQFKNIETILDPGNEFVDENVKFNTLYEYKLIRFDSSFRFSDFSESQTITTSSFPTPATPNDSPILIPAPGSIGVEIYEITEPSNVNILHYEVQFRSAVAESSNDGNFSVPSYPSWSSWETLSTFNGTRIIHNNTSASIVYQYRYKAVSNYLVGSGWSPLSSEVIPFQKTDRDELNLGYYAEIFHTILTTANSTKQIFYSHSSLDPQNDTNVNTKLEDSDWWWQTNNGKIWRWSASGNQWIESTDPSTLLLTESEYNALINSTVSTANKSDILDNFKLILFRKLTIEKFASKLFNIQEDIGYSIFKENFIDLNDTYFNAFYGILNNVGTESSNHSVSHVKRAYKNYIEAEIQFSEYIFEEYFDDLDQPLIQNEIHFDFSYEINNVRLLQHIKNNDKLIRVYFGTDANRSTVESAASDGDIYLSTESNEIHVKDTNWTDITSTSDLNLFYLAHPSDNSSKRFYVVETLGDLPVTYSAGDFLVLKNELLATSPTYGEYDKLFKSYTLYSAIGNSISTFDGEEWTEIDKIRDDSGSLRVQALRNGLQDNYEKGDILIPPGDLLYTGTFDDFTFREDNFYFAINNFLSEFNPNHFAKLLRANDNIDETTSYQRIQVLNSGDTLTPAEKLSLKQNWDTLLASYDELIAEASFYLSNFPYLVNSKENLDEAKNRIYSYFFGSEGVLNSLTSPTVRVGFWDTIDFIIKDYNTLRQIFQEDLERAKTQYEDLSGYDNDDVDGTAVTSSPNEITGLSAVPGVNSIQVEWTAQGDLTNFKYYEVQASQDSTNWYALRIDSANTGLFDASVAWLNIAGSKTVVDHNYVLLEDIPGYSPNGHNNPEQGRAFHFRIRVITKLGIEGTWGTIGPVTSEIVRATTVGFATQRSLAMDGQYKAVDVEEIDGIPTYAVGRDVWAETFENYAKANDGTDLVMYRKEDVTDSQSNVMYQQYVSDFTASGRVLGRWEQVAGFYPQHYEAIRSGTARSGGFFLRIGNNSGNNTSHLIWKQSIAFDPDKMYRVRARVKRTSGSSNNIYLGVAGRNQDDSAWVNASGTDATSDQYYITANNALPTLSAWVEYIGYIGAHFDTDGTLIDGYTGSYTPESNDPNDPSKFHANVRYFRPMIIANHNAVSGETDIDYFQVEEIDPEVIQKITRGINYRGQLIKRIEASKIDDVARDLDLQYDGELTSDDIVMEPDTTGGFHLALYRHGQNTAAKSWPIWFKSDGNFKLEKFIDDINHPDYGSSHVLRSDPEGFVFRGKVAFASGSEGFSQITDIPRPTSDDSLVAYWPFFEGEGTTAQDVKAPYNDGTLVGSPTWTTGPAGGALEFDASVNRQEVVSEFPHGEKTQLSVSTFIYIPEHTTDIIGYIISRRNLGDWGLYVGGSGEAAGKVYFQIGGSWVRTAALQTEQFYHIAVTFNEGVVALFIDGVSVTFVNQGGTMPATIDNVDNDLIIGGRGHATTLRRFNGIIADPRIYNRALSANEVKYLYENPKGADGLALIGERLAYNALVDLTDIASDSKLHPNEKKIVQREWEEIQDEKANYDLQVGDYADYYSVTVSTKITAYNNAFTALQTYINNNLELGDLTVATDINRTTFIDTFTDYYNARTQLQQALTNTANARLGDIADNNKLSPSEIQQTLNEWNQAHAIYDEGEIQNFAQKVGVRQAIIDAYNSAFVALSTLLNGGTAWTSGTPSLLADTSVTVDIDGSNFRTAWANYSKAKENLKTATEDIITSWHSPGKTNLVAYWPFTTINDGITRDMATGNYPGTIVGATVSSDGPASGSLSFNGTTNYAIVNDNIIAGVTALTVSMWIKPQAGGDDYRSAIHKAADTTVDNTEYWIGISNTDYLTATIGAKEDGIGWDAGQTTITPTFGTWYFMTAAWDETTVRVYIDGVEVKQYALASMSVLDNPTRFGASSNGANYRYSGLIADPRIYNRALTPNEITFLHDNPGINWDIWEYHNDPFEIDGGYVAGVMRSRSLPLFNFWDLDTGLFKVGISNETFFQVRAIEGPNEEVPGITIAGLDLTLTSSDLKTYFTAETDKEFIHNSSGLFWGVKDATTPINFEKRLEWETSSDDLVIGTTVGKIRLGTNANADHLVIDTNGNIGINKIDPAYKLEVIGTFRASGAATLSSTLAVTGDTTLSGTLDVTGATTLSSTLAVTGDTTLSGDIIMGNFKISYNSSTESLDFNYIG